MGLVRVRLEPRLPRKRLVWVSHENQSGNIGHRASASYLAAHSHLPCDPGWVHGVMETSDERERGSAPSFRVGHVLQFRKGPTDAEEYSLQSFSRLPMRRKFASIDDGPHDRSALSLGARRRV